MLPDCSLSGFSRTTWSCSTSSQLACATGGVAAIVAALLRDGTAPQGMGPVRCCVISPAAVFSGALSEACRPFITSLILRSAPCCRTTSVLALSYPSSKATPQPAPAPEQGKERGEGGIGFRSSCIKVQFTDAALPPNMPAALAAVALLNDPKASHVKTSGQKATQSIVCSQASAGRKHCGLLIMPPCLASSTRLLIHLPKSLTCPFSTPLLCTASCDQA